MNNQPGLYTSFKTRLLLLVAVTIFIVTLSITIFFTHSSRSHLMDDFYKNGKKIVENAGMDLFEAVVAEDIPVMKENINNILHKQDVVAVYIYNYNGNIMEDGEIIGHKKESIKSEDYNELKIEPEKIYSDKGKLIHLVVFTDVIEDFIITETVGYIRVCFSLESINRKVKRVIINAFFIFIIFMSIGVVTAYFYAKKLSQPLDEIASKMSEIIIKNDLNERIELKTNIREIELLRTNFNLMLFEIDQHRKMQVQKERLEKEFEIAQMIQTALLPEINKLKLPDATIDAKMIPADEVGGDYFDLIKAQDGKNWYGIGDVTGHGLIPGMIMMMAQTIANTLIYSFSGLSPKELIVQVNQLLTNIIRNRLKVNHYMTLAFIVDNGNGNYRYAGSHLDFIIYRCSTGKCEKVKTEGVWIGIRPDIRKSTFEGSFTLNPGDHLILYSDGLIEAMDEKMEQYGMERLIASIESVMTNKKEGDLLKIILEDVQKFMAIQRDDLTIFTVKRDEIKDGLVNKY